MALAFGARTGVRRTVTPNSFTDLSSCWEEMLSLSWINGQQGELAVALELVWSGLLIRHTC
jgi:hypothetical protein